MIAVLIDQLSSSGGPVLVALAVISVAAITVSIFKIIQFARLGVGRARGADTALSMWAEGNRSSAIKMVRMEISPTAGAVLEAMVSLVRYPEDKDRAREVAAHFAMESLGTMSKNLRFLETVAQAAPMLGLLGTVIGMISAFGELSAKGGAIDPSALAGGIWVALITTAAGLTVAIPVYFLSMWFEGRVDQERATMEAGIAKVLFSLAPGLEMETATQARSGFGPPRGQTVALGG